MDQRNERERPGTIRRLWERLRRWGMERPYLTDPNNARARKEAADEERARREAEEAADERH